MFLLWLSFIVSLGIMLWIAQRNLYLGLFVGALLLGIFNLSLPVLGEVLLGVVSDWSIILLAVATGIIPLIGAVLERSGLMDAMIGSLQIQSRNFLMLAPAFLGMLPMPGGALLSAPIVAKAGDGITARDYAAINVWFRHALVMIYPLGGLLATSKMAQMNVYREMVILIPAFVIMSLLGYWFLVRRVDARLRLRGTFDPHKFFVPLTVIIAAPLLHLLLMNLSPRVIPEIPLVIGVGFSLFLAIAWGKLPRAAFRAVFIKTRSWHYFLIIIGMFTFLRVFQATTIAGSISGLVFSKTFLVVGVGFVLGAITGRAQLAISLLLPIFYARYGSGELTPLVFALMYFAAFLGYLMSPIHPCILISLEYFQTRLGAFYRRVAPPFVLIFTGLLAFSWVMLK